MHVRSLYSVPLVGMLALACLTTLPALAAPTAPVTWFKAESLKTLPNGASVAAWPDTSGQGNSAAPVAPANPPTFAAAAINGLPAVHFDAAKKTQLSLKRLVQDDFTIVCVFQSAQGSGEAGRWYDGAGLVDGDVEGGKKDFGLSLSGGGQAMAGTGNWDTTVVSDGGCNDGKPHVATFVRVKSTGMLTLYVDGALAATAHAGTESQTDPPRLVLGSIQTNLGYFTGDIADVEIYDAALTDADRQTLESSLKTKYAIVPPFESPASTIPATQRLQPMILPDDPHPAIHGPRIVGASPQKPFQFLVPATGTSPLAFAATGLPLGLQINAQTGVISGKLLAAGTYDVHMSVFGPGGPAAERVLSIVCGPGKLALTPPMGWSSWNIYADAVTDANIRDAADALVSTGLASHGYAYVNLDDSWQATRSKTDEMLPNRRRFPDIKALGDYVHGKGLLFGLYSAGTEHTCAGFAGSMEHEAQDADTYAQWGVDSLKYGWCPNFLDEKKAPNDMQAGLRAMREALDKTNRDMVFAIATNRRGDPWSWGAKWGANSWETSKQIRDDWDIVAGDLNDTVWMNWNAAPGHWNDPGALMIGRLGAGDVHPSRLTSVEQMTQMSLWSLMAAPLVLSCDLSHLDPNAFHRSTTALLTNDEVLDVDQDPLGKAAMRISDMGGLQVWARPLSDGTQAVGLFNAQPTAQTMKAKWGALKLSGPQPVRDLWLHQELGEFVGAFSGEVPAHGVILLKVGKPKA